MTGAELTGLYVEKGARTTPRWVAVFRTSVGFRHVTLPLRASETPKEDAEAYALAETP